MSLLRQARSGTRVPRFDRGSSGLGARGRSYADLGSDEGASAAVGEFLSDWGRRVLGDAAETREQGRVETANRQGVTAGGALARQVGEQLKQAGPGDSLSIPSLPLLRNNTAEGDAFDHAVGTAYLTSLDVMAEDYAQRVAGEHPDDPQAFRARWDAAGQAVVGQLPAEMQAGASAEWMRKGLRHVAPIAEASRQKSLAEANATLISSADQYQTRALNAWRSGDQSAMTEWDAKFRETVAARTDLDARQKTRLVDAYQDAARTQSVLGHFDGAKRQGLGAAERFIADLEDPRSQPDLDPTVRDQLTRHMRGDLATLKAERQVAVAALRDDARAAQDALMSGRQFPALGQLRTRARVLGDTDTLSSLDAAEGIARDVAGFAQLPPRDQAAEITRRGQRVGSEVDNRRLDYFERIHRQTVAGVRDDPLGFAAASGVRQVAPIDIGSAQGLAGSLAQRVKDAEWAQQFYGIGVVPLLRKPEAEAMNAVLSTMPATDKAVVLGAMAGSLGPKHLPSVLEQAHAADPEFAHAGAIAASGDMGTAGDILLGEEVRRNFGKAGDGVPKMYLPTGPGATDIMRSKLFETMPDDAFKGFNPDIRRGLEESVVSLYAGLSYKAGDANQTTLNERRLKDAVSRVTGGILDWRGGRVLAPVRGMDQDGFDGLMKGLTESDIGTPTTADGTKVSVEVLRRYGKLVAVGPGRYAVTIGEKAVADPSTKDDPLLRGRYVLDLGAIARGRSRALPDAFAGEAGGRAKGGGK
jgi:hypothetical protein